MLTLVVERFDIEVRDCAARDGRGGFRLRLGLLGEEAT